MSASNHSSSPVVLVPTIEITIPPDRQRENAKADEGLINSIRSRGLINPIILKKSNELVAGERRLDAFRALQIEAIPARFFEDLTPVEAFLVEFQENRDRKNLTWQEEVSAVAKFHSMKIEEFAGWTAAGTATELDYSPGHMSKILAIARYLSDEEIAGATTLNGAFNLIEARTDRQIAAATARGLLAADLISQDTIDASLSKEEKTAKLLESMDDDLTAGAQSTLSILDKIERGELAAQALRENAVVERTETDDNRVLCLPFAEWASSYKGPAFDVIHCDFPYGKNYKGSGTRKTGRATSAPTYADTADIYFALVEDFLSLQDSFILPQAHCIFWMDMIHYTWTVDAFTSNGWRLVQPHPLIWTKSYQGVASDPQRRPRHCYETALLFSKGDRKIRKLDKDHFEEQVDEKLHISQKPIKMLSHFLSLVIDEHTAVLDPTCGSGTALVAASNLGAARLLGIEIDESNADIARFILKRELDAA